MSVSKSLMSYGEQMFQPFQALEAIKVKYTSLFGNVSGILYISGHLHSPSID